MILLGRARSALRRRLPPNVRHAYYQRKRKQRRRQGMPPTADPATMEEISVSVLGSSIQRAFHAEYGGYKYGSAWLVWLYAGRRSLTVVFKDVHLTDDAYPAIEGFPGGLPGLPEAALYSAPSAALKRYLPETYAIIEVMPGERFHYYLTDLNRHFRNIMTVSDQMTALEHLFEVGRALDEWGAKTPEAVLIDYSGEFPTEFLRYAYEALSEYGERSGDQEALDLCQDWERITYLYLEATPPEARDHVHGDYQDGNLFIHKTKPGEMKVVDWEFTGRGWIHNDLVSLFKRSRDQTVDAALRRLAEVQPALSLTEHRRLFLRCRLERSLMDAALVAKQRMAKGIAPLRVSRHHFSNARQTMDSLAEVGRGGTW
jgi:aminoglycoside phosphotransferase (APT) family kinase protein